MEEKTKTEILEKLKRDFSVCLGTMSFRRDVLHVEKKKKKNLCEIVLHHDVQLQQTRSKN